MEVNSLLPIEQKGSYGCKDQLLINKAIIDEVNTRKKNLTTAWIDYKKAFDSVPHDWMLKCLDLQNITNPHPVPHSNYDISRRLSLSSTLLHNPYSTILSPE